MLDHHSSERIVQLYVCGVRFWDVHSVIIGQVTSPSVYLQLILKIGIIFNMSFVWPYFAYWYITAPTTQKSPQSPQPVTFIYECVLWPIGKKITQIHLQLHTHISMSYRISYRIDILEKYQCGWSKQFHGKPMASSIEVLQLCICVS